MKQRSLVARLTAAISIISILGALNAVGQTNNSNYFGVRLGAGLNLPSDVQSTNSNRIGPKHGVLKNSSEFSVGGIYHINLSRLFYIEPGVKLSYSAPGLKSYDSPIADVDPDYPVTYNEKHASLRMWNIGVPVVAGLIIALPGSSQLHIFTGPELIYGLSADEYITTELECKGEKTSTHSACSWYKHDMLKRFDLGWSYGIGANICHHYYVGLSVNHGLLDRACSALGKDFHFTHATFSLGYNF